MLKIAGETNSDLSGSVGSVPALMVGDPLPVEWVTIPHPDPVVA